ncbi:MAG: hypothetical protein ACP5VP_04260 [Candidatus Limnocylindrales bacterium]
MNRVDLVVDEALGPGLEVSVEDGLARATAGREGGLWLGLDRAHLADSDAGDGSALPAVIALPASSFAGCRVTAELAGALMAPDRTVLVANLPGQPLPPESVIRTVARAPEARWVDAAGADRLALEARQRFRVRRQAGRLLGGRAWRSAAADPGQARFTTPHSRPEYRLDRLPPRFIRGLEGLLDDDERLLYAIERPPDAIRGGLLGLSRRGAERRAGLLVLSDRQLIWMVDHMAPDRYLMDWGVDARLVAVEALQAVRLSGGDVVELQVQTRGGGATFPLPEELRPEAEVMRDLLARFLPAEGSRAMVRRYAPRALDFDPAPAALFHQQDDALQAVAALREHLDPEPLLAAFYAPRRDGTPQAAAVGLTATRFAILVAGECRTLDLGFLRAISITLSPLIGRVELSQPAAAAAARSVTFTYPATVSANATAVLRVLRHAWADRASTGARPDEALSSQTRRVGAAVGLSGTG